MSSPTGPAAVLLVATLTCLAGAGLAQEVTSETPSWPAPEPAVDTTLPDPFARRSTPLVLVAFVGFLVVIAAGALWLGRRRRPESEEDLPLEPEGPRLVMAQVPRGRRRPPGFYEDLRQRETELENLEESDPGRPRPKVIELPVADHPPVEGDG
jgi:hypothetical protein